MPFSTGNNINKSSSITHKMTEYDKMSPYFIKQKQQSIGQFSQSKHKGMPGEYMEINGSNPYSRNRAQDQVKTTYSQQTQDFIQSVQKNSSLINNIKQSGSLIGGHRIIPANVQFRKSVGAPVIVSNVPNGLTGIRESDLTDAIRPVTGKP